MRKLVTAEMMKRLDEIAVAQYGVKAQDLIANAGQAVAEKIIQFEETVKKKKIIVACGKGNNGADGLAAAEQLAKAGAEVYVYLLFAKTELSADMKKMVTKVGKAVKDIIHLTMYDGKVYNDADIIVDAIFGTGFNANPEGVFYDMIRNMNDSKAPVYSIDIPSGIHGTTGNKEDIAVSADYTFTLGFPKLGLYINDGYACSGEVHILDIGFPAELDDEIPDTKVLTEISDTKNILKKRPLMVDKKDFGKVFNFAGSLAMPGAAILSSVAAIRTGTGLLKLGIPMNISASISTIYPEVMTIPLAYAQPGYTSINAEKEVLKGHKWGDACLVGPGLSVHPETKKVAKKLFSKPAEKPMVIDADGLNMLAESPELFTYMSEDIVLTPHNSEMARLVGVSKELLLLDRIDMVVKKAQEWNCFIVLKGTPTLIAQPDGKLHIHVNKNPGMAVGGMGDVLSGILVSLLGQRIDVLKSIYMALYIHSVAADIATKEIGEVSLLPSDVVKEIPKAIKYIQSL